MSSNSDKYGGARPKTRKSPERRKPSDSGPGPSRPTEPEPIGDLHPSRGCWGSPNIKPAPSIGETRYQVMQNVSKPAEMHGYGEGMHSCLTDDDEEGAVCNPVPICYGGRGKLGELFGGDEAYSVQGASKRPEGRRDQSIGVSNDMDIEEDLSALSLQCNEDDEREANPSDDFLIDDISPVEQPYTKTQLQDALSGMSNPMYMYFNQGAQSNVIPWEGNILDDDEELDYDEESEEEEEEEMPLDTSGEEVVQDENKLYWRNYWENRPTVGRRRNLRKYPAMTGMLRQNLSPIREEDLCEDESSSDEGEDDMQC